MVRRRAVLVVEDDDDHREALEAFLCLTGLDAFAVRTGTEALTYLRREPRLWCLVVLDWWLPDMTAEDFRRRQRTDPRIAEIAVAVLTGDVRAKEAAERAGFRHFLLKPVEPALFTELLTSHCQGILGSASENCGCADQPVSRRQQAGVAGGRTTSSIYGAIWKSVAAAHRNLAESRRTHERARRVRELAQSARVLRFKRPEGSFGLGTVPMACIFPDPPDGRATVMRTGSTG